MNISITPQGIIQFALGGYLGTDEEINIRKENSQKIVQHLFDYMNKNKLGIVPINDELVFTEFKITPNEEKGKD